MSNKKTYLILIIIIVINQTFQNKNLKQNNLQCPSENFFSNYSSINFQIENPDGQSSNETNLEKYKEILSLKKSFMSSLKFLPQEFSPEEEVYFESLDSIKTICSLLSLLPILFIIIYIILRFFLKKCKGPKKAEQVSHFFRNFTWIIYFLGTISTVILILMNLIYSVSINSKIRNSFNNSTKKMDFLIQNSEFLEKNISNLRESSDERIKNLLPKKELVDNFVIGVTNSLTLNKNHITNLLDMESSRNKLMIILFFAYIFIIGISFYCFLKKLLILLTIFAILTYLYIPIIFINEGYTLKFFFLYGDLCQSVYNSIRENAFPVPEKGLGYYINCLNKTVKSDLYSINYMLNKANEIDDSIKKNIIDNNIKPFLDCDVVYNSIPILENDFCKSGLNNLIKISVVFLWLMLATIFLAVGIGRMEVLVWKKKMEIESMIENEEAMI